MNQVTVRAAEHLKNWVSETIDKYHDSDVNPAQVKLLIWDEIQATLFGLKPKHFQNVLWLRVSKDNIEIKSLFEHIDGEILSSRCLGPRNEKDSSVFYITILVPNAKAAIEIVDNLTSDGYTVRDWSYGANRR